MAPAVQTRNIGRIETLLRILIGVVLLFFSLSIDGILKWAVGLIGAVFILTALFGY